MNGVVIDSSVVAKWILPEPDSVKAQQVLDDSLAAGVKVIVLDLVFPEVTNAIWKQRRSRQITDAQAAGMLSKLNRLPIEIAAAMPLITDAFAIATKYDRAVYDALFVALAQQLGARGVTADEPLYNATRGDFPGIALLRTM